MKISADTYYKFLLLLILMTLMASLMTVTGCGRVGDPLPPIRYKALVPEMLRVAQRGDTIILNWPKPGVVAMQQSNVIRADILRRDERSAQPARLTEEQFLDEAKIVGSLTSKEISMTEATTLHFADPLPMGVGNEDIRFRYAIRYVKISGDPFPLSNYALLEPVTQIAQPPTELKTDLTQETIKIDWTAPTANLDSSAPAVVMGYNIYRKAGNENYPEQPLNSTPLVTTSFEDHQFKFGNEYSYIVRSLSQGKDAPIESPSSTEIKIKPKDTFAPIAPANVTGASAASVVSLFWPANSERDIKGYFVYRAESSSAARDTWMKLTPEVITTTTFRDEKAQAGKTYYYFITAIDRAGNESEPSTVATVEVAQ